MPAPKIITDLIERFEQNKHSYKTGVYNEAQVRQEFINPFFNALGWDVYNNKGYAEAYKDVIHEYSQKTFTGINAPDYGFRIGGQLKFFVEAKKPGINIKDDIQPAYQLRRYAWSSKLPLSILTDFEEFAVYDCRILPKASDKASAGRILYYSYADYLERWDEIENIFSPEAIKKGSFDRYAASNKNKRGTAEVDEKFLEVLKEWREVLARNIALRNPLVTARELNFAVQKTIDRIIFLRICEDRGIEEYGQLNALQNGENVYKRLLQLFTRADEKYNSGLFHFEKERDRSEEPDSITTNIEIDDKLLKDIFKHLYYPHSPFEFSVLPADILGQVYEQFLGKVIRLTNGHQAKVEDKPEVKKAGGVFYTPTYIVNYIVENTLGRLLDDAGAEPVKKNLTPKEVSKIKILDPACGSGSFLIVAYQYLLEWHLKYYTAPENLAAALKKNYVFETQKGEYRLTTGERKRILLNNIYGVDIDSQAVEVTKLSLLLKVLEGETDETLTNQMKFFRERALPDLGSNIKCGNSLIGPDFYDQMEMNFLDDEEKLRINVFDWQREFKDIMNSGGFDVVIGNPPYIRIQAMKEWAKEDVEYYKNKYSTASKGNYDIYVVFVEKGFHLLNQSGRLGFILPNKFLLTDYGDGLRELISSNSSLYKLIDFKHGQVFPNVTTYTCLLFLAKSKNEVFLFKKITNPKDINSNNDFLSKETNKLDKKPWLMSNDNEDEIINKINFNSTKLSDIPAKISRGSSTGSDKLFMFMEKEGRLFDYTDEAVNIERELLRKPIFATDFSRYNFHSKNNMWVLFPYLINENKYTILEENELEMIYPNAYKYLLKNRKGLEQRKQYSKWYGFSAPRNLFEHNNSTIIIPLLADRGLFTFMPDNKEKYCLMASGGFSIWPKDKEMESAFILGLLNSKLLFWYLEKLSNNFRGGWITCTKQYMSQLPVKNITLTNKVIVQNIVSLVSQVSSYHDTLITIKNAQEKTALQRQIDAVDRQIDNLVYQLYGLTEEEIKIVEGE